MRNAECEEATGDGSRGEGSRPITPVDGRRAARFRNAGARSPRGFLLPILAFLIQHSAFPPMAITALNSAATGLRALSTRIDVVANNLANAETTAFKRSRVNFEDLMYLHAQAARHDERRRRDLARGHLRRPGHEDQQHAARPRAGRAGKHRPAARRRHPGQRVLQRQDPRLDRRRLRLHAQRQLLRQQRRRTGAGHGRRLQAHPADHDPHRHDRHHDQPGRRRRRASSPGTTTKTERRAAQAHQFVNPQGLTAGRQHLHRRPKPPARRSTPSRARTGPGRSLQGFLEGATSIR